MDDERVRVGKAIQRRTGRTFRLATRLLPERVRRPTYVLYGFFRVADEVVDGDGDRTPEEKRRRLERVRDAALGRVETDDPVLAGFREVAGRYGIDDREVDSFVDAMLADVHTDRYETHADLESYVRGSAAAVGVMMTDLMQPDAYDRAVPHARRLGVAFQLTNFLRDVREDARELGRVYLPMETLAAHGVTEEQVLDLEFDDRFAAAMAQELRRAEACYRDGVAGIQLLPADCQFPVLLAAVCYADHHRLIRERGYDVLASRPTLGRVRLLSLFVRTRWHWAWNRDPETVFRRVTDLPEPDRRHAGFEPGSSLPTR